MEASGNSAIQASASTTITVPSNQPRVSLPALRLTASSDTRSITRRRVSWTTETVDNEGMGKKKSKCCCVYHKPRNWNESSSEDENEDADCQNCRHHRKTDFNSKRDGKESNQDDLEHDHHHGHSDCTNQNSEHNK